eukprot:s2095_g1.t1
MASRLRRPLVGTVSVACAVLLVASGLRPRCSFSASFVAPILRSPRAETSRCEGRRVTAAAGRGAVGKAGGVKRPKVYTTPAEALDGMMPPQAKIVLSHNEHRFLTTWVGPTPGIPEELMGKHFTSAGALVQTGKQPQEPGVVPDQVLADMEHHIDKLPKKKDYSTKRRCRIGLPRDQGLADVKTKLESSGVTKVVTSPSWWLVSAAVLVSGVLGGDVIAAVMVAACADSWLASSISEMAGSPGVFDILREIKQVIVSRLTFQLLNKEPNSKDP